MESLKKAADLVLANSGIDASSDVRSEALANTYPSHASIGKIHGGDIKYKRSQPIKKRKIDVLSSSSNEKKNKRFRTECNHHEDNQFGNGYLLKPAPFFHYTDHSEEPDEDPLTPLTPMARVPNFPAKMHAILARSDLSDVIAWQPHGRGWKILKPREFEIKVLPTYFQHSKFSSFVRQANGWGFRRITRGEDLNTYYHELFLRGLPHLCKKMRRPGVAEKTSLNPEHEPNLYEITKIHHVPAKAVGDDDSILLKFTVSNGPKARMPVHGGLVPKKETVAQNKTNEAVKNTRDEEKKLPFISASSNHGGSMRVANEILDAAPRNEDQELSGMYRELYRQRWLMHEHQLRNQLLRTELSEVYRQLPHIKAVHELARRNLLEHKDFGC